MAGGFSLHHLWRRLPSGVRRSIYRRATEAVAPRVDLLPRSNQLVQPFIVAGCFGAPTGLGEAARLAAEALADLGLPVGIFDLTDVLRQPRVVPLPALPPMQPGAGTLLAFVQPPNVAFAMRRIGARLLMGKRRVGCWVWDLEQLPADWRSQLPFVHELAAPSRFVAQAFANAFDRPVRHLIHPVAIRQHPPIASRESRITCFGAAMDLGSTVARKNPFAVVNAYRTAFEAGDPVELALKIRDLAAASPAAAELADIAQQPGAKITILAEDLGPASLEGWWRQIDVLVSLHRSEGFGLFPAEAMLRGIPVISTDWSATREYIDSGNGWPVAATLVQVIDESGRYGLPGARWAEPDLSGAVVAMREAAGDRAACRAKGARARERITRLFSAAAFLAGLGPEGWVQPSVTAA